MANRDTVVHLAKELGWKEWGKLTKKRGLSCQCFRRGNFYAWIGLRFVECSTEPTALDFYYGTEEQVREFLR
jgi:hypothetical protein